MFSPSIVRFQKFNLLRPNRFHAPVIRVVAYPMHLVPVLQHTRNNNPSQFVPTKPRLGRPHLNNQLEIPPTRQYWPSFSSWSITRPLRHHRCLTSPFFLERAVPFRSENASIWFVEYSSPQNVRPYMMSRHRLMSPTVNLILSWTIIFFLRLISVWKVRRLIMLPRDRIWMVMESGFLLHYGRHIGLFSLNRR